MSLDVYLEVEKPIKKERGSGIFIRETGRTFEIGREEWDMRNPGREPVAVLRDESDEESNCVFSANITHNLNKMAEAAGLYKPLWRPDELDLNRAEDLIAPLSEGLARLKAEPRKFEAYNPANGWGNYDLLVRFVDEYREACARHPEATIRVCR